MKRNTCDLLSRSKSASEETLHSSNEEEDPFRGMEPYLVRRLSCRNVQLPPLAFRQLEQADLKSESENIPRPTSLPLKILPLIAITSADSSGPTSTERLRQATECTESSWIRPASLDVSPDSEAATGKTPGNHVALDCRQLYKVDRENGSADDKPGHLNST